MAGKHPVSLLQELMAGQHKQLPSYEILDVSTRLTPSFECRVKIDGIQGVGKSSSKQSAKTMAATDALKQINIEISNGVCVPSLMQTTSNLSAVNYNAIGTLNEYTAKNKIPYPSYHENGMNSNEFIIQCTVLDYSTVGSAPVKKVARQIAAHNMVKLLENRSLIEGDGTFSKNAITSPSDDAVLKKFRNLSVGPIKRDIIHIKTESIEQHVTDHTLEVPPQTTEEINDELEQLAVNYNIETLNKNPFVLMFKCDNEQNTAVVETVTYVLLRTSINLHSEARRDSAAYSELRPTRTTANCIHVQLRTRVNSPLSCGCRIVNTFLVCI